MSIESVAEVSGQKQAQVAAVEQQAETQPVGQVESGGFARQLDTSSASSGGQLPADGEGLSVKGIENVEFGAISQAEAALEVAKKNDMLELPMFKRVSQLHGETVDVYNRLTAHGAMSPEEMLGYQLQLQQLSFEMRSHLKAVGMMSTGLKEILRQQA